MYDIRSAMLNIGIVFTPGKFKINLEKTWKTPGILVNLRSTDPDDRAWLKATQWLKSTGRSNQKWAAVPCRPSQSFSCCPGLDWRQRSNILVLYYVFVLVLVH